MEHKEIATNSRGVIECSCNIKKITLEEAQTIRDALAVHTEEQAEKYGIPWTNEGTREGLLLEFIRICDNMEAVLDEIRRA